MSLTWSYVPSIWERAQLEQLQPPGHLLLPDVMNLRGEKLIFPFLCFEACGELSSGENSVTQTSHDRVPCFLLQRRCLETVQGVVRKGQVSPQKPFSPMAAQARNQLWLPKVSLSGIAKRALDAAAMAPWSTARSTWWFLPDLLTQLVWSFLKHFWKLSTRAGRRAVFITWFWQQQHRDCAFYTVC